MSLSDQKTLSIYQIILHYPFFTSLTKLQKWTIHNLKNVVKYYIFSHFNRGVFYIYLEVAKLNFRGM